MGFEPAYIFQVVVRTFPLHHAVSKTDADIVCCVVLLKADAEVFISLITLNDSVSHRECALLESVLLKQSTVWKEAAREFLVKCHRCFYNYG